MDQFLWMFQSLIGILQNCKIGECYRLKFRLKTLRFQSLIGILQNCKSSTKVILGFVFLVSIPNRDSPKL